MRIKTLILSLCLVLVVLTAAAGTIAYLTDTDEVVNSFTVGNIDMKVEESPVDENGQKVEEGLPTKGNSYHLLPGKTYSKDPYVTIAKGSDPCYVRMKVTINKVAELKAIFGDNFLPENYVGEWNRGIWPCAGIVDNGDNTATYEFRYCEIVDASLAEADMVLPALFQSITVPGEVTSEQLKTLSELNIKVVGHAIQADTFADADAAWFAFGEQTGE